MLGAVIVIIMTTTLAAFYCNDNCMCILKLCIAKELLLPDEHRRCKSTCIHTNSHVHTYTHV